MTEIIFAIAIFALAAEGIGLGLMLERGFTRTRSGPTDRLARERCADCPLRRRAAGSAPT